MINYDKKVKNQIIFHHNNQRHQRSNNIKNRTQITQMNMINYDKKVKNQIIFYHNNQRHQRSNNMKNRT